MTLFKRAYRGCLLLAEIAGDLLGITLAFLIAHDLYPRMTGTVAAELEDKAPLMIFVTVLSLVVFFLNDLYRKQKSILNIEETRLILKCLIISSLVTFALFELTESIRNPSLDSLPPWIVELHSRLAARDFGDMFSRLEIALAFGLMFPLLSVFRYMAFKIEQNLHRRGVGNDRVLVYGGGDLARRLQDKIAQSPKSGYSLVGRVGSGDDLEGLNTLGDTDDIEAICNRFNIDRIIVADAGITPDRLVDLLHRAQALEIELEFVPALHSLFVHRIRLSDVDGLPLISVKDLNGSWLQRSVKRVFDLTFGGLASMIALIPGLLIALWIKLDDPNGPVLFSQERAGRDGKPFRMYKFRSMRSDAEAYARTPGSSSDPRITRAGRWLRRFSLDELPQLINVLAGSMSLVGPRPEMPFIAQEYGAQERERLRIKPGITGLWQISADRSRQIHENLDYDLYYIEHQDLLLDVVILLRTLASVLRGRGAW